jgi:subtilisin family serine protease
MRKKIFLIGLNVFTILLSLGLSAQEIPETLNWYNKEGVGMATDKGYGLLKKKKSESVVVAVIDSGVDIEHEDLQGKIWVNSKEIPNNKIDDDKNGYVDDVHGWNFLGNATGQNLENARLEKTRILAKLIDKYDGIDPETINGDEEFQLFQSVEAEVKNDKSQYEPYLELIKSETLDGETKKYIEDQLNYYLNIYHDDRSLIGDNPDDFNDVNYGNSDVEGPDALHGTHVAGIIAAIRGNKKGGDGVADNVKIMSLRAVPNGDEQDKDIALAIRYAVDNGAQIINMSFGKSYSLHQQEVFEVIQYADSKGVLMIHAAGNDSKDIDFESNFPTSNYSFQEKPFDHFLTIGASTNDKSSLMASFSNYGQTNVDVFAPGFEIYSTIPQSAYKNLQGTSMAAPMVSGVAALLKSYFPTLGMKQIKDVILSTAVKYHVNEFNSKSVTGGVVNVYNAIKACQKLEKIAK